MMAAAGMASMLLALMPDDVVAIRRVLCGLGFFLACGTLAAATMVVRRGLDCANGQHEFCPFAASNLLVASTYVAAGVALNVSLRGLASGRVQSALALRRIWFLVRLLDGLLVGRLRILLVGRPFIHAPACRRPLIRNPSAEAARRRAHHGSS